MPTWKGMFTGRRVVVALSIALAPLCALSVAGAAPTTTTSGGTIPPTTTSVPGPPSSATPTPPPDQFALPTDFGFQLVQQQEKAKADLALAERGIGPAKKALATARKDDVAAQKRLKIMRQEAQDLADQLAATRAHLAEVAAQAYMHADEGQLAAAISSITNAQSAVDVGSKLHMISTYGDSERTALSEYIDLKQRVDGELRDITVLAAHTSEELASAAKHVTDLQNLRQDAATRIMSTVAGIAQFEKAATSASSPILGPSRLSANQMADYVMSTHARPNITVPLVDLAQLYLDEGAKTGVRGDVAFAQSILETGGFANPGSSATDNNFAGIGWCDSCAHGFNFPDARTGVRAQVQELRIYVDPNFPEPDYTDPILLPGTLKLGFRGKVQTWWDLWGTWATGALYGQRVYDIYEKMVAFAATDPPLPPKPLTPPANGPPPTVGRPPNSGPGSKP